MKSKTELNKITNDVIRKFQHTTQSSMATQEVNGTFNTTLISRVKSSTSTSPSDGAPFSTNLWSTNSKIGWMHPTVTRLLWSCLVLNHEDGNFNAIFILLFTSEGLGVHHMLPEHNADHKTFEKRLQQLALQVQQLSKKSLVIWFHQNPVIQMFQSSDTGHFSNFITPDLVDQYNVIAKRVFRLHKQIMKLKWIIQMNKVHYLLKGKRKFCSGTRVNPWAENTSAAARSTSDSKGKNIIAARISFT